MSDKIEKLLGKLNKNKTREFPVLVLDDPDSPCNVDEWISTGVAALDAIMGGGLPVGRIVEIYGDTSTGKTLVAEQAIAAAQHNGILVLYIDTERAASKEMMEAVGIDSSALMYADPDTIEEVFQLMEDVLINKEVEDKVLIVWDSIAATTVQQEKDADYGKATMGRHANLMSQGLRKFNRLISKHEACALFVNQTRQAIGVMFGDDETTFGGKAVPFYSSIRIRLKAGKKIKEDKQVVGINTTAIIVKNKLAKPFGECDLPIYFGEGVDDAQASMLYLKATGDIEVRGGWHYITIDGIEHKWQGVWYDLYDKHYEAIKEMIL